MILLRLFLSLLLSCSLASAVNAQDKWDGYLEFTGKTSSVRTFGQSDLFVPLWQDKNDLSFFNLRGKTQSFDFDEGEYNIGIGHRHLYDKWILGVNGFVDHRETEEGKVYRQVGFGIEAMSEEWDFRANGYIPDTSDPYIVKTSDVVDVYKNDGGVWGEINEITTEEKPMPGFDLEIGRKIPIFEDTRLYAGAYQFFGEEGYEDITGGRARIETRIHALPFLGAGSRLMAGAQVQYDDIRGDEIAVMASLRIPFGVLSKNKRKSQTGLRRRMVEPVVRDTDIVLGKKTTSKIIGKIKRDNEEVIALEAVIHELEEKIEALEIALAAIGDHVDTSALEKAIADLKVTLAGHPTVTDLEDAVAALETEIAAIGPHTDITALTEALSDLQETVAGLGGDILKLEEAITALQDTIAGLGAHTDISDLEKAISDLETALAAIGPHTDISSLEEAISDLQTALAAIGPHINVTALETRIQALEDKLNAIGAHTDISDLEAAVAALQEALADMGDHTDTTALEAAISDLQAALAAIGDHTDITALEAAVAALELALAAIGEHTDIEDLEEKVEDLEKDLADLKEDFEELKARYEVDNPYIDPLAPTGGIQLYNPEGKAYTDYLKYGSDLTFEQIINLVEAIRGPSAPDFVPLVVIRKGGDNLLEIKNTSFVPGDATWAIAERSLKVRYRNGSSFEFSIASFIPDGEFPGFKFSDSMEGGHAIRLSPGAHINGFEFDLTDKWDHLASGVHVGEPGKYYITNTKFIGITSGGYGVMAQGTTELTELWLDEVEISDFKLYSAGYNPISFGVGAFASGDFAKIYISNSTIAGANTALRVWAGGEIQVLDSSFSDNYKNRDDRSAITRGTISDLGGNIWGLEN